VKKVIASFLAIFYLTLSCGLFINLHYCGGELELVAIQEKVSEEKCCGVACSNNCCQDKLLELKIKDAHKLNAEQVKNQKISFDENQKHIYFSQLKKLASNCNLKPQTYLYKPPNFYKKKKLSITYCQFLI
jgi:hypothetical protein